jgi:hypothetical protein
MQGGNAGIIHRMTDGLDEAAERYIAIGTIAEFSAGMEWYLANAFCALLGSKYAAVVAGGQGADWLIENCRALVNVHRELTEAQRTEICDALTDCKEANRQRNILVHSLQGRPGPDGSITTLKGKYRSHVRVAQSWTLDQIRDVALQLLASGPLLDSAIAHALGPEAAAVGMTLTWEDRQQTFKRWTEFAVELDYGETVACANEAEARAVVERQGGKLMKRDVFETSWSDDSGQSPSTGLVIRAVPPRE